MKIVNKLAKLIEEKRLQNVCLGLQIIFSVVIFAMLSGGIGIDYDEAFSWDVVVNHDVSGILAATAADVHPPLYYLIVKASFAVFGESMKVMLWTSVFPVILGMILAAIFIRRRWGFGAAVLFNLAYGFAPFILHYNLNLRMYSWMDLFVLGVILTGYEMVSDEQCKVWHFVSLLVFSLLAVYTQYFAVLPIVVCYAWIFVSLVRRKDKKGIVGFLGVGLLDVVFYIPWLVYGMKNMGIGTGGSRAGYEYLFKPADIFAELFGTNLENGGLMAMVLFVIAVVMFVVLRKKYSRVEKSFLIMLLVNTVFCWYFSQWLGSLNGHFFASRYVIFCLMFVWIFLAIVYSRCNVGVSVLFSLWCVELCLSSFLVEKAYEYDTTPLMPQTVAFIDANVEPDAVIVYDYDRGFKVIWQYYMPGHEFIYFDDLNLEELEGKTFWVINLAGADLSQDDVDRYSLEVEHNPGMGFMGMERFDLWKVSANK